MTKAKVCDECGWVRCDAHAYGVSEVCGIGTMCAKCASFYFVIAGHPDDSHWSLTCQSLKHSGWRPTSQA